MNARKKTKTKTKTVADKNPDRLIAVIDIGTTSIRMSIAEVDELGNIRQLENLYQAVNLGKDTFTRREIGQATTEECVNALRSFRQLLDEYRITDLLQIRAIATSAVREAINRESFLDRIYIATGFNVEAIDEAEVNRFTYLSVQPLFQTKWLASEAPTVIVEVGGGNTEVLAVKDGKVTFSHMYKLGSLRMRQMIEDFRAPVSRLERLIETHIGGTVNQVPKQIALTENAQMLALGGDARFAAIEMHPEWDREEPMKVSVAALYRLTKRVLQLSVDELVRKHHLSYPDAETLGPALLTYVRLARALKLKNILVAGKSLRDGLLTEMATRGSWSEEFLQQITHSAIDLGKKYDFDKAHAEYVTALSRKLFHELANEHKLPPRYEYILTIAGLLHEIGRFISERSHHKHSMYLILNSELFGVGHSDLVLTALVARYHRKALPRSTHMLYSSLDRDERVVVSKLGAILRLADAFDTGHTQRIKNINVSVEEDRVVLTAETTEDLSLVKMALQRKAQMFESVYGKPIVLRAGRMRA